MSHQPNPSSDIVSRLRDGIPHLPDDTVNYGAAFELLDEAAAEIERLRARVSGETSPKTTLQPDLSGDVVAVSSIITGDGRCYGYYWTIEDAVSAWPKAEAHYGPGVTLHHSRGIVNGTRTD